MAPVFSKNEKVGLALCCVLLNDEKRRKKRKIWAKQWLIDWKRFTHANLVKELDASNFQNFLRMDELCFNDSLIIVKPYIDKKNTSFRSSVSAEERLIVTLRYLATGRSYEDLKFSAAISPQLLSAIIPETCAAIYLCLKKYIKIPNTEEEWKTVAHQFKTKWKFNNAVGEMDGKHVSIQKPTGSGSQYFNYKKFFSIVLFGVVDANYQFMYVNVGANGSVCDSTVLVNTSFYRKLINDRLRLPGPSTLPGTDIYVPHVFLGDSGFNLSRYIMKPYPFKNITHEQRIFNYRLSRARRVVENAFGILESRFRIFQQAIAINVDNVHLLVLACCALHNYLSQKNATYITPRSVDTEDIITMQIRPGDWREVRPLEAIQRTNVKPACKKGKDIRKCFLEYFNDKGSVEFQEYMLRMQ